MNLQETAQVLAKVQLGDNRQVDELTVREWHDAIGHLALHEAMEAVRLHRQESTEWVMPAHVIANVRRVREEVRREARIERAIAPAEPKTGDAGRMVRVYSRMLEDPAESEATKAWIRSWLDRREARAA